MSDERVISERTWCCSFRRMIVRGDLRNLQRTRTSMNIFNIPSNYDVIFLFQRGLNGASSKIDIERILRLDNFLDNNPEIRWTNQPFYDRGGYQTFGSSFTRIDIKFGIYEGNLKKYTKNFTTKL